MAYGMSLSRLITELLKTFCSKDLKMYCFSSYFLPQDSCGHSVFQGSAFSSLKSFPQKPDLSYLLYKL